MAEGVRRRHVSGLVDEPSWRSVMDYRDPRLFHMPNYRHGMIHMVRTLALCWKRHDLPAFWAAIRPKLEALKGAARPVPR